MIPLAVRSHFSLMRGTAGVKELCRAAKERGFTCLALTDRDNLYGLWPFLRACVENGLRPMVGAEVTQPGSEGDGDGRAFCLAKDDRGYVNLCRVLSRRHRNKEFDLKTVLPDLSAGLLVLTPDPKLLRAWAWSGMDLAAALEVKPCDASARARKAARELGLPAVAVPASFFIVPEDYHLHKVLRAIDLNTVLSRLKPTDMVSSQAWLASAQEYGRRFDIWPEAITGTHELGERISFTHPPTDPIMPPWADRRGRSPDQVLREKACRGARRRYGPDPGHAVRQRLEHELAVIQRKNFSAYFLVVQDIIKRSPRICGRGSGAASLVAYCLGITNVCPLKHNLYFERFINADRKDPPDIDVDFAWDERDGVLASVLEQHAGHAAMVCNHVLFQGRMAIRETAKVYGLPEAEIKAMSKELPWLRPAVEKHTGMMPRLKALPQGAGADLEEPWPEILTLAQQLVGAPRHLSVHSGGMIITPRPIREYVPLENAPKGVPIIQWEKDGTEDGGLVKIDLLGNRSLGVIRDAVAQVKANGVSFDEGGWEPEDDPVTQKMVARGKTMGCFYIESPATRLLQQKAGRGDFEHLVIHSSIIRPAANEFIQEYLRRLKGGAWEPLHPLLGDILGETYGIMVYQEDVSKTAVALAGFSHAEADGLRKVMTRKDKEAALRDYKGRFFAGAGAKGVALDKIQAVWEMMLSFSGYSFCKPHSASYARVSFQAAFLKAHFPAEFMAAVISNQGGFYSAFAYVSEARRLGLEVLPPDVTSSQVKWTGRGKKLRVGLMALKDLGKATRERIVALRKGRPFRDFADFHARVGPEEDETRALIRAGAFGTLCPRRNRASLLWELARRKRTGQRLHKTGQTPDMFAGPEPDSPPPLPQGREIDRLRDQYRTLGFLIDRHPMVLFAPVLKGRRLIKAARIREHVGRRISLAGWLITGKVVRTKKAEPMEFLTFEDETDIFETTFFPKAFRRFCADLDKGRPYIVTGLVEENFGAVTLTVDRVEKVRLPRNRRAA